jgi:uncharacterized protein (DUF924 family)
MEAQKGLSFNADSGAVLSTEEDSLRGLITPALLNKMVSSRLPLDRHSSLDFSLVARSILPDTDFGNAIRDTVFPVLQAMSKVGLDKVPDLMTFLPRPTSGEFPEQCLGLILLLDQAPRALCEGVDVRWVRDYFDPLSLKFAARWHALPSQLRPDRWYRWNTATGTSFDFWLATQLYFVAPLVHSESLEHQELAVGLNEQLRNMVEIATGSKDPYAPQREKILSDYYGLSSFFQKGPPQGPDVTAATWAFWSIKLLDLHRPIIHHFLRYPYCNAVQGRENTPEEEEFLVRTNRLGEPPPDVIKRIKEDIAAGRWSPLGQGQKRTLRT